MPGVLERLEIAIDRPQRDAEPIGELLGGDPGAAGAERLGEGEQAGLAAHAIILPYKPDRRLSRRGSKVQSRKEQSP